MANFEGRLKGKLSWEKALFDVAQKHPESVEAKKALQMIEQIKGLETTKKNNIIYHNYKWIFTFNVKDTTSINFTKSKLQNALEQTQDVQWFLSVDRFDQDQTYLVLHGIRNKRKLNEWIKRFDGTDQKILNTNNFVVLSSDYKKMLLNKTQFTNEKQ